MDACWSIYWCWTCHAIYYTLGFMLALSHDNKKFIGKEPFEGLFTQGMVCHETYKDKENNWLSPDEVFSDDGKNFLRLK